MTLREEHKDLFTVDESYYLAHCIASDLRMGAGIAVPMQKIFDLRRQILASGKHADGLTCILTGRVFNLITKRLSSGKPTHEALEFALIKMRKLVEAHGVKKIAMPKIGCGLDRLQWGKVKVSLQNVFKDTDVEILVCVWP